MGMDRLAPPIQWASGGRAAPIEAVWSGRTCIATALAGRTKSNNVQEENGPREPDYTCGNKHKQLSACKHEKFPACRLLRAGLTGGILPAVAAALPDWAWN